MKIFMRNISKTLRHPLTDPLGFALLTCIPFMIVFYAPLMLEASRHTISIVWGALIVAIILIWTPLIVLYIRHPS